MPLDTDPTDALPAGHRLVVRPDGVERHPAPPPPLPRPGPPEPPRHPAPSAPPRPAVAGSSPRSSGRRLTVGARLAYGAVAVACLAALATTAYRVVDGRGRDVRVGPAAPAGSVASAASDGAAASSADGPAAGAVGGPGVSAAPAAPVPVARGSVLVAEADGSLVEVAPTTGARAPRGALPFGDVRQLVLSPDRTQVYASRPAGAQPDRTVDVYRFTLAGGEELRSGEARSGEALVGELVVREATAFALRADGARLAWATDVRIDPAGSGAEVLEPAVVHERDVASGAETGAWPHAGYELQRITRLAYSPDGRTMAYVAQWESGEAWLVGLDGDGSDGRRLDSAGINPDVTSVGWWPGGTLVLGSACCTNEGSAPMEIVVMTPDGELESSTLLDAPAAAIQSASVQSDPATGLLLVLTDHLERRDPDGGVIELGPAVAASF